MAKIPDWYVITGGPSSGSSSVISCLSKMGYFILEEAARILINQGLAVGKSLQEIRGDEVEFQRKVLGLKIEKEAKLPRDRTVFLDRALPDSIAYFRNLGVDPGKVIELCREKRYQKIFLLTILPGYEKDYARIENREEAMKLARLLREAYLELGYEVVGVPMMPGVPGIAISGRTKFILERIKIPKLKP